MPYEWQKPKRLLKLQIGDTANEQIVVPAYSAPGVQCDNMIMVLNLITHLVEANSFGVLCKHVETRENVENQETEKETKNGEATRAGREFAGSKVPFPALPTSAKSSGFKVWRACGPCQEMDLACLGQFAAGVGRGIVRRDCPIAHHRV